MSLIYLEVQKTHLILYEDTHALEIRDQKNQSQWKDILHACILYQRINHCAKTCYTHAYCMLHTCMYKRNQPQKKLKILKSDKFIIVVL